MNSKQVVRRPPTNSLALRAPPLTPPPSPTPHLHTGVTASVAVYPMETARTRMALGTAHGHFLMAVAGIASREGVGALFKVGPAHALPCPGLACGPC